MKKPASSRRPRIPVKDLAYLAGFFDGEGCVQFQKNANPTPGTGGIRISIMNTDRKILQQFQQSFKGSLRLAKRRVSGYRTIFQWYAGGDNARRALRLLIPYLREKRPQAELALRLCAMAPADRLPGMAQLKALKRVDQGVNP